MSDGPTSDTMSAPARVAVLGSTGSIGLSTLSVLARHPDQFELYALTAHRSVDTLVAQCRQYRPQCAVLADERLEAQARAAFSDAGLDTLLLVGEQALSEVASADEVDVVMAAIVGAAGLRSTLAAARAGKKVLIANKEALVMAGGLFTDAVQAHGATLLPIDSEHNAIFQCLPGGADNTLAFDLEHIGVRKILLTGSGGPFRQRDPGSFASITPAEACAHPNWSMGRKISVDSATMMNKGLELIEACFLFNCQPAQIEIVVHPQSVIHSMVEYVDGSVLAQLGQPDMCTPIAHALAWPQRIAAGVPSLDWTSMQALTFEPPDHERFPALALARAAAEAGGNAPIVLNAANEVAVDAFLREQIGFAQIAEVVAYCLEKVPYEEPQLLEAIQAADVAVRELAATRCRQVAAAVVPGEPASTIAQGSPQ